MVGDNNNTLRDTIDQTADRLEAMDKAVYGGIPDALGRMKTFAEYVSFCDECTLMTVFPHSTLKKEINELKDMSSRGLFKKLLESEVDKGTIAQCVKRIDEATKTVLVCIYIPIRFQIYLPFASSLASPGAPRGKCMR